MRDRSRENRSGNGLDDHAVVLGASMAGLAAAATLAPRFARVTIVDRDVLPEAEARNGVPQGRHAHLLLPSGLQGLAELFPGILDDLQGRGAHIIGTPEIRFNLGGGRLALQDTDMSISAATRPLIEGVVRQRVQALPGVRVISGRAAGGLVTSPDRTRVTGVRLRPEKGSDTDEVLEASVVVDATGRSSRSPEWLSNIGYEAPEEERIRVGVHYTTRLFRRRPEDMGGCRLLNAGIPADGRQGGLALAVEGDRWLVTLVGFLGERPPTDLDGFVDYARQLWTGDLHEVVDGAEPIGEAATGAFPAYLRRRYDRLRRFPAGYVVLGDALCSLSPLYGQGMSVAIREAQALGEVLDGHGRHRLGPRFFRRTRPLIDVAWKLATGSDLVHPEVEGQRSIGWRVINAYVTRGLSAAHHDPLVARAFLEVNALVAPPQHMMRPRVALRVLTGGRSPAPSPAVAGRQGYALPH